MIVNYKRDLNHSYLILDEKAMDSKEYFQLQMLTKNQIAGLLNLNISMFNGENSLQYDISSKQNLLCIYDQKVITEKDMEIFLFSIQEMLKRIENYLLDPDYLLLNPEFMYLNISENQLEFCFYPCEKNDIRESIRVFSEYLLNRIDHQVEKVVALAYKFYRLTRDPNFNYEAIIEELFSTPENNAGFDKLSPKYAPAIIAPAATLTSTWPLFARTMRITPMVPAVPKEEPNRKDMMELRIKADSTKNCSLK